MNTPPYLQEGDTIAIIAPARKVSREEMMPAIKILTEWGLNVVEGNNLYKQQNQFAGSDSERLEDLQNAINNKNVGAILFARGGYGSTRIIGDVNFSKLKEYPKWFIGFSDITSIHLYLNEIGFESLHAPMAINFSKSPPEILTKLKHSLFGINFGINANGNPMNRQGFAKGILTGGNLSLIYAESASNNELNFDGRILFIEDIDEYLYHIDRMIVSLKRSSHLCNLAGLIVGGMTDMKDNTVPFGKTAEEIVAEHVAEYDYPVCFNFTAGHIQDNHPLIFGREVELHVGEEVTLKF